MSAHLIINSHTTTCHWTPIQVIKLPPEKHNLRLSILLYVSVAAATHASVWVGCLLDSLITPEDCPTVMSVLQESDAAPKSASALVNRVTVQSLLVGRKLRTPGSGSRKHTESTSLFGNYKLGRSTEM